jgi:NAD(P)H dehydrogenase (quinone)
VTVVPGDGDRRQRPIAASSRRTTTTRTTVTILITGATGQLGSRVVSELLRQLPAKELAVSTRRPERAADLDARGVDVRHGDFDDPGSLEAAFTGVDRLLLISTDGDNPTRIRQHAAAVAAAEEAGVGRILYTSLVRTETSPLGLAEVHRATEAAVEATGLPHTFLRNGWYLENEIGAVQGVLAGAPVLDPVADARICWVTRDDLAAATAAVLLADEPEEVYELAGPPRSYRELAAALSEVLDGDVPVQDVDDDTYAGILTDAGLPPAVVGFVVGMQPAIRDGALDTADSDLERLLGRPATPLVDSLSAIVSSLRGDAS